MARGKIRNNGSMIRNSACQICDKVYRGNKKMTTKLIHLHMKTTHGIDKPHGDIRKIYILPTNLNNPKVLCN